MKLPSITISHRSFHLTIPSLELEPGEIVGIFGKSGAGKTSYLKKIREMLDPREVHYMSQFDGLLEEITIRQNIELGLAASGKTDEVAKQWEKNFDRLLKDFEVDRHLHKYPRAMSGGQRKRSEIVRSLIMDPPVLLLDEPFVGIGHLFEAVCTHEIIARGERKKGVTLIVSHDFDLLCTFSHRILLVDDKGVIGFVPTKEKDWHPQDVRTAWTLAVENVLPAQAISRLEATGLPKVKPDQSIGFWGWSAMWGESAPSTIEVRAEDIRSMRSALKHGTLYTRIEVAADPGQDAVVLVGQGTIPAGKKVMLGIQEAWVLNA